LKTAKKNPGSQSAGIFLLSFLLLIICSSLVFAHHELLPAPEREYLKLISLHPFKDTLISKGDYHFFITVAESAPDTYDLIFYIENWRFIRPVRSDKELLIFKNGAAEPERFVLGNDITGASFLRYIARQPFEALVKVAAVTAEGNPISVETNIQIGSPKASVLFIMICGLILVALVLFVGMSFPSRKQRDKLQRESSKANQS